MKKLLAPSNHQIILMSKSPRRRQILENLGIKFEVQEQEINETYPETLKLEEIPIYLAELKASAFEFNTSKNELIIAADTIVAINNEILGKPENRNEAEKMLKTLSGKSHKVITGVCLKSKNKQLSFSETTIVDFKPLSEHEISFYIDTYQPYDKAGGYAIQEWIGLVGIRKIEGSYFNVVGLPVQRLYEELIKF